MQNYSHTDKGSARERGFTIAELAFGIVVLVISAVVLVNHLTVNYTEVRIQKDRVFAFSKAQGILAEIQSYVDRGAISAAIQLDALDDGVTNKPTLTITEDPATSILLLPNHPLSANYQRSANWVWSRRISVRPFLGLNNRNVRYVTVRVYKKDGNGIDREVASVSSVVNSVGSAFPTTQVFDIYLLAVENIPGWWVFMEAIIPFVESAITDLESRNPGLKLRTHWIRKASYGRNQVYRPYINDTVDSNQPVDRTYYYPGRMPSGNSSSFYYVPDLMKARMSFDGTERHGYDPTTNPYPYALADFYNHAMRYPHEKAYHDTRVAEVKARKAAIAAAIAAGNPPPAPLDDMDEEPTLRLFLEDLCTNPDKYRNALIINLHGELMPMPSLRNYSDAAKSPNSLPEVRVVTHPEELRTRNDSSIPDADDVVLRVYSYATDPDNYFTTHGTDKMPPVHPIAIQIMGINIAEPGSPNGLMTDAAIEMMSGGQDLGSGPEQYSPIGFQFSGTTPSPIKMYHEVSWVPPSGGQEGYTLIKLYNSPVLARYVQGPTLGEWRGLSDRTDPAPPFGTYYPARLYNLEYIPSSTRDTDFSRDLSAIGDGPKNTARWRITIPDDVWSTGRVIDTTGAAVPQADYVVTVRTRIWDDVDLPVGLPASPPGPEHALYSGSMWPVMVQPDNFSETYTWWTDSPDDVPFTERSQFQGDPRHNPYKDLWNGDPDFGDGYNWYHDALNNDGVNARTDYPGIDEPRLVNRWQGAMRQDVPRFFEVLRTGLVNSNAVYTTLTGYSYYYMGHGNEIGYDSANGYPSSIPVNLGPFNTTSSGTTFINNITGSRRYVRSGPDPYWWGIPWLGELYPDRVYATQWVGPDTNGDVRGNLTAAGWGTDRFFRWQDYSVYYFSQDWTHGTRIFPGIQRTSTRGSTTFFNIDNSPGHFTHLFSGGNGSLVGSGLDLANNYNFPVPSLAPINRPWSVSTAVSLPEEYGFSPYSTNRYTANIVRNYYNHPSGAEGSGLVELVNPGDTEAAYIVVNGISNAVSSGSSFIAKYSLLTMVQSFLEGGDSGLTHRIKMPPRVEIQAPTEITELNNPATIPIQWDTFWVRWDGLPYTSTVSVTETETELEYVLMYSKDNGTSWYHVQDDTLAVPGEKPTNSLYLIPDSGVGGETYNWSTPIGSFPEGSYLIRSESYRQNQELHYSQHMVKIFISRA